MPTVETPDTLVWVKWYATILRQNLFAAEVAKIAPLALRYGATQYRVHIDGDDRYKITQMTWVPSRAAWYTYWEGPEMIEFRARWMGKYQVPITYAWAEEIAVGEMARNGNGGNGNGGNGHGTPATPPPGEGDAFSTPAPTA